jgi:hypothetical protein
VLIIGNPANAKSSTQQQNLDILVGVANSTTPGRVIVTIEDDGLGSSINRFATNSATIQGHHTAAGAITVGASFYFYNYSCTETFQPESFSSQGGILTLFDPAGARLATPTQRQKPDITATDGVNDTFLGFTLASDPNAFPSDGLLPGATAACQNRPSYPNFFGTSAATPHAAGMAALMMQANGGAAPAQIYDAIRAGALLPSTLSSPNYTVGQGELYERSMAIPTMSSNTTAIAAGGSATITWSTILASSCVDGNLNPQATSGSMTVTPATLGGLERDAGDQRQCHDRSDRRGYPNLLRDLQQCEWRLGQRHGDSRHRPAAALHSRDDLELPVDHRRCNGHGQLVVQLRGELHRVGKLERHARRERIAEVVADLAGYIQLLTHVRGRVRQFTGELGVSHSDGGTA